MCGTGPPPDEEPPQALRRTSAVIRTCLGVRIIGRGETRWKLMSRADGDNGVGRCTHGTGLHQGRGRLLKPLNQRNIVRMDAPTFAHDIPVAMVKRHSVAGGFVENSAVELSRATNVETLKIELLLRRHTLHVEKKK